MSAKPSVLVVDDEEVVCKSCRRVLATDGFRVDTSTDVGNGMELAETNDYAAILLDIKMSEMDGLEFLRKLRETKPSVPVIMITGYPSQDSMIASMRLGASDYIRKPFSGDEITEAVKRVTKWYQPEEEGPSAEAQETGRRPAPAVAAERPVTTERPRPEESVTSGVREAPVTAARPRVGEEVAVWEPTPEKLRFRDEAWVELCNDGTACVGGFLPRMHDAVIGSVSLPKVGDTVHQGLPLAALEIESKPRQLVRSPLSGRVTQVNKALAKSPAGLWEDPCREGWIARIEPTHLADDLQTCRAREVIVATTDDAAKEEVETGLVNMGCKVHLAVTAEGLLEAARVNGCGLAMIDAASFQDRGPKMVGEINEALPELKVVVFSNGHSRWEAAYRAHKILYYAVEPFVDLEIVDILFNAFRSPEPPRLEESNAGLLPQFVSRISITNHYGEDVCLLSSGRLMMRSRGLGLHLVRKILDQGYPIKTTRSAGRVALNDSSALPEILGEAEKFGRLVLLEAEDTGRIPGTLRIKEDGDLVKMMAKRGKRITALVVQSAAPENGPLAFDARTTDALADHILREMTSK